MRSFETTGTASQTRKAGAQRAMALSLDLCEFLDMLTAIETRQAAESAARG